MIIKDADQREMGLDITKSILVKANAGSGKTGLLIQRILKLLATVKQPDAVLAITFTNKAAGEMRSRVATALQQAEHDLEVTNPYDQITRDLAKKVLSRDKELNWNLMLNPNRLNIQTIDSLCANLTKQMPMLSHFGTQPEIADNPSALYREASEQFIATIEDTDEDYYEISQALGSILAHLDNHLPRVIDLFTTMLSRREQWLPLVLNASSMESLDLREQIESYLSEAVTNTLQLVREMILSAHGHDLIALADFAGTQVSASGKVGPIASLSGMTDLPGCETTDHNAWLAITEMLLTQKGAFRVSATAAIGFPAPSKAKGEEKKLYTEKKQAFGDLIDHFKCVDGLDDALQAIRILPPAHYTDVQWTILESLLTVLPQLVAHLHMVFKRHSEVDYAEVSHAALQALGDVDQDGNIIPTDLSLKYDNQLEHLLIDEFQDTNHQQMQLVKMLTAGWHATPHKTLFMVGDPMQSIYRFREADVGLFLSVADLGVGDINVTPIELTVNFRSSGAHVRDVNNIFKDVMPIFNNIHAGAVSYTASDEATPATAEDGIEYMVFTDQENRYQEAQAVCDIILRTREVKEHEKIAVIVRNRSHLTDIITALRSANIAYQAVDIDPLNTRQAIKDIFSLTRAMIHGGDRLAWLSLMRSPLVGLSKADLLTIANCSQTRTVLECLNDVDVQATLTSIEHFDLKRIVNIFELGFNQRQRKDLRRWIEGIWIALGGPSTVNATDLVNVHTFFDLLESQATLSQHIDMEDFSELVSRLYAKPDKDIVGNAVQLMTIHKSKGLEFDTVIIPGLDRISGRDNPSLLLWQERSDTYGQRQMLLAPITETGQDSDIIYRFIQQEERTRQTHEECRQLYVACTRAAKKTYLLANLSTTDEGEFKQPNSQSLLARIHHAIKDRAQVNITTTLLIQQDMNAFELRNQIQRLKPLWEMPEVPVGNTLSTYRGRLAANVNNVPDYEWSPEFHSFVGQVIHTTLQIIHDSGIDQWTEQYTEAQKETWRCQLSQLGMTDFMLNTGVNKVADTITRTCQDEVFKGLMNNMHQESIAEMAITTMEDGEVKQYYIDLMLLTDSNDRWVIDYKTAAKDEDVSLDEFIATQTKLHEAQLHRYEDSLTAMYEAPVKKALYFTDCNILHPLN